MKLLTKAILTKFRKVWNQEANPNPLVICKFFHPCSCWSWYATEYDEDDKLFFGFVVGIENERGAFSLDEFEEFVWPLGLKVERDKYFSPRPFSELGVS